jgi:hypothetical protein
MTPPVDSAALRSFAMGRSVGSATDEWRAPRRLLCEKSLRSVEDRWRIFGRFDTRSGYASKHQRPGKTMPDLGF